MAATASRKTLSQLLKQGWNEIPEVIGSTGVALAGIGLAIAGLYNYAKNDGENTKYKMTYVVMRPDDPRVKVIRKD